MKYIIDIDALKDCIDLLDSFKINGHDAVFAQNVKLLIDRFPKDRLVDLTNLIVREDD